MTERKKKVLILDNSSGMTGAFRSIYTVTQEMSRGGRFEFYYGVPTKSKNITFLKAEQSTVVTFSFLEIQKNMRLLLYFPLLLINTIRIQRFVRSNQISVVHVNDLYNMCGVVLKYLNPKIKVIYHVRLLPDSYVKILYKYFVFWVSKKADSIIAVSDAVKKALTSLSVTATVIYDGLVVKEKYGDHKFQRQDVTTFLYLSNFIAGKGHHYALEAFASAQKQNPRIKMIMAGGDLGLTKNIQLKQELKEKALHLNVADHVEFRDHVDDVEQLMKSVDVVLNFSESESFSLTCLEALFYGTPLIATDCGGPAELFENEISGLLVPNRDAQAMTAAMVKLSLDQKSREAFSQAGKKFATEKFHIEKSARILESLYDRDKIMR